MKWLKILLVVVVLIVAAFFVWNYLDGPLKYRRDIRAFAASLETCRPFERRIHSIVGDLHPLYTIESGDNETCRIRIETFGGGDLVCTFPADELGEVAPLFAAQAEQVDLFGGYHFKYSSSNPDRLTAIMNSSACGTSTGN